MAPTCRGDGWGGEVDDVGSGRWPNVLIAGAQKAATSSVWDRLWTLGMKGHAPGQVPLILAYPSLLSGSDARRARWLHYL